MRKLKWVFPLILFFCAVSFGQKKSFSGKDVGEIVGIEGTAILKTTDEKQTKLNSKNFWRRLLVGQKLKVDENGKLDIRLCNKQNLIVTGAKWYEVPSIECLATNPKRRILSEEFDSGGRVARWNFELKIELKRNFILFPIDSNIETIEDTRMMDTIRPETITLRWRPVSKKLTLLLCKIGEDEIIWGQKNVDGKDGFFTSDNLKKTLKNMSKREPDIMLKLIIQGSEDGEHSAIFKVFSLTEEKSLEQELNGMKMEKGISLHLARAQVFTNYQLHIEAANEYEEALKFSPESVELLEITSNTQERVGNLMRKAELEMQFFKLLDMQFKLEEKK